MHVSDKVSYHLSDSFFRHLLASDFVATESDPSTWITLYDALDMNQFDDLLNNRPFYSRFYQKPPTRENLLPLFQNDNNIVNNLLSRTSENQKDYQEDTYLDMFIYQTGRKYKKKVVGLENAKTSMISVMNAEPSQDEDREENMQAITKVLRERTFNQAMLDFYREKNLDMLDSLYVLMTPANYHKALILDRNLVMVKSIDSLARKGSLFAAVGAAHLPGKKGIIELLRDKGYTVKPVIDGYTEKGRTTKKTIDDYFIKPDFSIKSTPDGMVSLPMLAKPIYSNQDIGTPDLANGAMINLKRLPLRDYLRESDGFNPQTLDSLFYENIPGTILQKRFYSEDNYSVYDITNKTKTGNAQHSRYYITPLEIICVSMNGNGNYVRKYENEIFANIKLKKSSTTWESVSPNKGGFSVDLPAYHTIYGNRDSSNPENIEINAFDATEKSWYFLSEYAVNDNETLEETAFELKRIQQEFFTQLHIVPSPEDVILSGNSYESRGRLGQKHFRLKTIVNGQHYYLLGTVNASSENTKKFFGSFTVKPFRTDYSIKKFTDGQAHFSMDLPEKENEHYFWKISEKAQNFSPDKKNIFKTRDKQYNFVSPSGQTADVFAWSYHRYDFVRNRDTLLVNIRRNILDDYNKTATDDDSIPIVQAFDPDDYGLDGKRSMLPFSTWDKLLKPSKDKKNKQHMAELVNEKLSFDEAKQLTRLDVTAQRPGSEQAARYTAFMQDGFIWYIRSLVPKAQKEKDFIDRLADSFEPLTQAPEHSLFQKKTEIFIGDAKSENDSIRYSAFESVDLLQLDKTDLPALKEFLTTFEFRPEETQALSSLLERIGNIRDPQVVPFLDSCYRKENVNAMLQLAIIRALAKQKSKVAYKKIAELLEHDLPLSNNQSEIAGLFFMFGEDAENSKVLYPGIFQYYGVSEYQDPIVQFTTRLISENQVSPKKLKAYRKLLLADARLEAKRVSVWKTKQAADDDYFYGSPTENLKNYANLLYAFKKDKAVAEWFKKAAALDLPEINLELVRLDLANGAKPNQGMVADLLGDPATGFAAYRLFYDDKSGAKWADDEIAKALVASFSDTDENAPTIEFLTTRTTDVGNRKATLFFFRQNQTPKNPNYGLQSSKLVTVAFLDGEHGIDPQAWKFLGSTDISDASKLDEEYDVIIDRLLNSGHARASFGKQAENNLYYPESDY